jgi:protein TonB
MDAPVETVVQPETKMPAELIKAPKNITPVVTSDTSVITTFIPITDVITDMATNEKITDTLVNVEKTDDIVPPVTEPFIRVEEMPEFPGGESALLAFIAKNTIYPEEAIRNNITGRVILKFVVNPDGSVGRTEIIRGIDILLDQEAIRVIGTLPRFRPGKQNGIAVPVWYSVPVNFKIKEMN